MKIAVLIGFLLPSVLLSGDGYYIHRDVNGENCRTCHIGRSTGTTCHLGTEGSGCVYCHHWTETDDTQTTITIPANTDCTECHRDSENYRVNSAHEIYSCTTCHSPHGSDFDYLLRETVNDLCSSVCHLPDQLGRSHPRGAGTIDIHTGAEVTCVSTCHRVHTTRSEKLLVLSPPYLCASCHADKL